MRRVLRFLVADQRGMSLAEILVACVIIAIGLVGLLSAVPTASYGIQEGQQLSTATFLANQRLEQARNAQWVATPVADTLGVSAWTSVPTVAVSYRPSTATGLAAVGTTKSALVSMLMAQR